MLRYRQVTKIFDFETGWDLENKVSALSILEEDDFSTKIINSTHDGIVAHDCQLRYTIWNPAMERLTGVSRQQAIGKKILEIFPYLETSPITGCIDRVLLGEGYSYPELPVILRSGRPGYVHCRHTPLFDEEGKVVGGLGVIRDVTEEKEAKDRAEQLKAELESKVRERTLELENALHEVQKRERSLKFLAEAGVILSSSLNYSKIVSNVLKLTTDYFQGLCSLRLISDGDMHEYRVSHENDLHKRDLIEEIEARYPIDDDKQFGPALAMRARKPEWLPALTDANFTEHARDEEHLRLLRELALKAYICVPLVHRDEVLGALSLYTSKRYYTDSDFGVAQDLARLVALAFSNAKRLQDLTSDLQRNKDFFV